MGLRGCSPSYSPSGSASRSEQRQANAVRLMDKADRRRISSRFGLHRANSFCYAAPPAEACGRGGIGRRAALRSLWGNPWKFESSRPHHFLASFGPASARYISKSALTPQKAMTTPPPGGGRAFVCVFGGDWRNSGLPPDIITFSSWRRARHQPPSSAKSAWFVQSVSQPGDMPCTTSKL